jgi:hypothetical protein
MTLWQIITGNSTLPIQAGNTFWDHLNNPKEGEGSGGVTLTNISTLETMTADIPAFLLEANIINVLSAEVQDISTQIQVDSSSLLATSDAINVDSVYDGTELGADI